MNKPHGMTGRDRAGDAEAARGQTSVADPEAPARPTIAESKDQLLAAYDRLVEHEATKPKSFAPPPKATWRKFVRPVVLSLAVGTQLYLWIGRPAWLYPSYAAPDTAPPAATAERTLLTVGMLVRAHQDDHGGALPASLEEIGVDLPWAQFVAMSNGGFRLSTIAGDVVVTSAPAADVTLEE